jgi:hypothetical protein
MVEGFALTPHLDKPVHMLSTGSKRKVWFGAALASGRTRRGSPGSRWPGQSTCRWVEGGTSGLTAAIRNLLANGSRRHPNRKLVGLKSGDSFTGPMPRMKLRTLALRPIAHPSSAATSATERSE